MVDREACSPWGCKELDTTEWPNRKKAWKTISASWRASNPHFSHPWDFPWICSAENTTTVFPFKTALPFSFAQKHEVELYSVCNYLGWQSCCLLLRLKGQSPISGAPNGERGCHEGVSGILVAELWLVPHRKAVLILCWHSALSCLV